MHPIFIKYFGKAHNLGYGKPFKIVEKSLKYILTSNIVSVTLLDIVIVSGALYLSKSLYKE